MNSKEQSKHVNLLGIKPLTDLNTNEELLDLYTTDILTDDTDDVNIPIDNSNAENIIDSFLETAEKKLNTIENTQSINQIANQPTSSTYSNIYSSNNSTNQNLPVNNEYSKISNIDVSNIGIKNYSYENKKIEEVTNSNQSDQSLDLVKNYINETNNDKNDKLTDKTYEQEIDDEKILMIDKIDEIKKILCKKDINIDNVPIVTYNSSLPEIKYTYRLLQVKNNRDLNINFTNTMVKISISLLEKVFDGQKTYFGITPNLTGYSKIAHITLQDLNLEAEQLSGEIFNRQSTNPALKIAAAIIPGMIYYSTRNMSTPNSIQSETTENKKNIDDMISEINDIS